jgi:hypothetical protein
VTRRRFRRVTLCRFRCKLLHVRSRLAKILSAKAALFVLLAFQLIVGLPLQTAQAALDRPADTRVAMHAKTIAGAQLVARAATVPAPAPIGARPNDVPLNLSATTTAHADCPMHDGAHGATRTSGGNKHAPTGNHDCCHVSACQCQCVYTPAAFDLPAVAANTASVVLPSLSSAQFVAPRIDEFLRPPIA